MNDFEADDLDDLSSAEDFLNFFGVEYDPAVVQVNRLHILQRFHDYRSKATEVTPERGAAAFEAEKALLTRAYLDFVESDAISERVFKVLKEAIEKKDEPKAPAFVAIGDIAGVSS